MPPISRPTIVVSDHQELHELVHDTIEKEGVHCDLNHIDVSGMTSMRGLFAGCDFQGRIDAWNVANVEDFDGMFVECPFNGNLSKWNVGGAQSMERMFQRSHFNGDIAQWNTARVENMRQMFEYSHFNGDVSRWDVSGVVLMRRIFDTSAFAGDLSQWRPAALKAWDEVLDSKASRAMAAPSVLHWMTAIASAGRRTQHLTDEWRVHFERMRPVIDDFELAPYAQACMYQDAWLRVPCIGMPLPDLGI